MYDTLFIRQLRLDTIIGVHPWERQVRQTLFLDLDLAVNIQHAVNTDDVQWTLNYQTLTQRLMEFVEAHPCQLIETLADGIAQFIMQEFAVPWLKLSLHKPGAILHTATLGITLERGQR